MLLIMISMISMNASDTVLFCFPQTDGSSAVLVIVIHSYDHCTGFDTLQDFVSK